MATEFRSELAKGTAFSNSVTYSLIANDTDLTLWAPVILIAGASATKDLPKVDVTTAGGSALVFGVLVALPASGTIVAGVSVVQICVAGLCKIKVVTATVALNDALETSTTAGQARVQADVTVDATSLATLAADVVIVANNVRKAFAIALSSTSNASSIILCYVSVQTAKGNVT